MDKLDSFSFAHTEIWKLGGFFCHTDVNSASLFGQRIAYSSPGTV